ncbi:hypothetical protein LQZ18_06960 [Lachnospiraceae bacterium ZAX-1]
MRKTKFISNQKATVPVVKPMGKAQLIAGLKVTGFVAALVLLTTLISTVLANGKNDYKFSFKDFYSASANEVDVVYMGASSTNWNFNPVVAYHENGVASQLMGSAALPADAMPYLLKEASIKKPSVYIIDVQRLMGQLSDDFAAAESVIVNLRLSQNRLGAAKGLLETYTDEEKMSGYFPLGYFHGRWKNLSRNDFVPADMDFMGWNMYMTNSGKLPAGKEALVVAPNDPGVAYIENLNKVFEVCKGLDGKVLFMVSPNDVDTGYGYNNFIRDEVTKAGYDYLDASGYIEEIGIGLGDFAMGAHLTMYGAEKYTKWLSGVLMEKYGLPDRREQRGFKLNDRYESVYQNYLESKVKHGDMLSKWLESINTPRYSVLIAIRDEATTGLNEDLLYRLSAFGLTDLKGRFQSSYVAAIDGGSLLYEEISEPESANSITADG